MYVRHDFVGIDFSAVDQTFDIHDTGTHWMLSSLVAA
jgi:hypothetical protein